jgi:hypothetical protein
MSNEESAEIQRLKALVNGKPHLRTSALWMAGSILQASEEEVVGQLINGMEEDIVEEGGALYNAYEGLYRVIAKEFVQIVRELSQQAEKPYRANKEHGMAGSAGKPTVRNPTAEGRGLAKRLRRGNS